MDADAAHESPVSLQMDMSTAMTRFYWLYWRLYETHVRKADFERRFADDARLRWLLQLALHLRLVTDDGSDFVLTERGAFWIHLMQNYYVLNYIDKVWTQSMREACAAGAVAATRAGAQPSLPRPVDLRLLLEGGEA